MRGSQPAGSGAGIGTGTWRGTRTVLPAALSGPARGDRIIGPGSNPSCTLSFPRLQRGKESGRNTLLLGSDNRNSRARSGPAAGASSPFQRPPGHAPFSPGCLGPLYSPAFGGPGPWALAWLHPDVTWGVSSWRAQGGWAALPTHGGRAPPQHPRVPWGCRWPRATEWDSAGGVSRLPPHREGGTRGGIGGAVERPLLRAVALCHFPQARPGLGACLLTRQAAARRPAPCRSRKKAGPGAAGKPGPAPRSPHPAARPLRQRSPLEPGRRARGAEQAGMGDGGAGWGQWR